MPDIAATVWYKNATTENIAVNRVPNVAGAFGEIHIGTTRHGKRLACKGVKYMTADDESPLAKRRKRVSVLVDVGDRLTEI